MPTTRATELAQVGSLVTADPSTSTVTVGGTLTATTVTLPNSSVTTASINDAAVTTAKIADANVTTAKIADSGVTTAKVNDSAITYAKLSTSATESDNVAKRTAKAWVNFDGTGTPAIREDFNVSSITDNGIGDYTVNFTTAMEDANYCAVVTAGGLNSLQYCGVIAPREGTTPTTSAIRIQATYTVANTAQDNGQLNVAIFR